MNDMARRTMIRTAMKAPYLQRDEEHRLAVLWKEQQDQQAMHRIATAHMRLVISMASRFRNFGLPMGDLIQEGYIGLLEAASRFDPDREVRFSTYASWWIRASMQDYVLRNWSIVRGGTSSSQKALFFNLRRMRANLASSDGLLSSSEIYRRISGALGVPEADVASMDARLSSPDASLNQPMSEEGENGSQRMDFLASDEPVPVEVVGDAMDAQRRSQWLNLALDSLNERELKIIRERRLREEGATLEVLGRKLGISKERVRQIENRAIEKLRAALVRINPDLAAPPA
jgi:RNA polymerase sigma-32 factor